MGNNDVREPTCAHQTSVTQAPLRHLLAGLRGSHLQALDQQVRAPGEQSGGMPAVGKINPGNGS